MDPGTISTTSNALIQGGFAVVSIVLAWVVYKLWEKNDVLQKEKSDALTQLQKEKSDALNQLQKDKAEAVAKIQGEKDELYKQVIATSKEDVEEQMKLNKELVTEFTKVRQAIAHLTAKRSVPGSIPNGNDD